MRVFVGIALADAVARELADLVARLRNRASDGLRWSKPESWHVTLQFLGNATVEQLECLKARLGEVRCGPVAVELGELGAFDRAGVFFADVKVTRELAALQQHVAAATSHCGFVAEARAFHPHITLARKTGSRITRERGNKKTREQATPSSRNRSTGTPAGSEGASGQANALRELKANAAGRTEFTPFTAQEFLLYESHLERDGARYEVHERFRLDGA